MEHARGTPNSPVVLVDALNVARSIWPHITADRLVSLCQTWAEAKGHDLVVVFDGRAPETHINEPLPNASIVLIGSEKETADQWIEREAGRLASEGAAYWLVTSDRELRDLAGRASQRTIGGGAFARELTEFQQTASERERD